MAESHLLDGELPLESAGQKLSRAREAAGLSRAQIAERTKIPERHLLAIEQDNFAALPARTYAVGFSRNYARALGLDEAEISRLVRADIDGTPAEPPQRTTTFEPGDPARIPSSAFAWLAGLLALGVVVAGYLFWRSYYAPAAELPPIAIETPAAPASAVPIAPAALAAGQVVFTALEPGIWVKFYDTTGQLLQKELARGESYSVPPTADGPMIWTARPQALAITIDGRPVAKLAERQMTLKDVPVTARALLARPAPAPVPQAPGVRPPLSSPAAGVGASPAPAGPTPEASTVSQ